MKITFILFFILSLITAAAQAQHANVVQTLDWAHFFSRHDLKWTNVSNDWYSSAFIGNGQLGAMIYKENDRALRWDIGRSDVTDHSEDLDVEWGKARLPIGKFLIKSQGKIINATMKLDLWNAEATGTITSDKGSITWRSFVTNDPDVIIVNVQEIGSEKVEIEFVPEVAQSPRFLFDKKPNYYTPWFRNEYLPNPKPLSATINKSGIHQQPLLAGGGFTTSWKVVTAKPGKERTIFISVGYSQQNNRHSVQAMQRIKDAEQKALSALTKLHQDWWHKYYPQSFLSIPDTRLESFYWIQQYKLASATRSGKQVLDLMGPWYNKTPWPALWWNLNIQLNYLPVYTSNRLSLGESLCAMLDKNVQNFIKNVPEQYQYNSAEISRVSGYDGIAPLVLDSTHLQQRFKEAGNLTWILHNYWMQCKYGGDNARMVNKVYPLLVRSVNYLLHQLEVDSSGKLHLMPTYSPEYTARTYADCNYTLSSLRWGTETLIDLNKRYKLNDTLSPQWQYVLQNVTNYPQDSVTGLHIGLNEPLRESHRHYSHLLMIYPLRIVRPENDLDRSLIEKSLAHWTGLKGAMQGYTFTGAASISALLGKGDDAINYLNSFIDKYVQPNTFYREAGPVIETPLSAVASINEMLLQSFNDEIHVFPAVPTKWKDVCFKDLRTEGAFLITAKRANFKTTYVGIKSLKGGSFKLAIGSALDGYKIKKSEGVYVAFKNGVWNISLKNGAQLQLYSGQLKMDAVTGAVEAQKERLNSFGSAK